MLYVHSENNFQFTCFFSKLFSVLLRTNRVYERSKHRLLLQDHTNLGLFPGLVISIPEDHIVTIDVALSLLDQMFVVGKCIIDLLILDRET